MLAAFSLTKSTNLKAENISESLANGREKEDGVQLEWQNRAK